ncbi:pilus assembly PilX family protein [Algibacillus agarilyticus]|uniref:pilus assembly PilX family protein n=1 Tax=Algibacillus agarilyticus TaxID=2234133 RepID=UPI000DCF79DB|nr:hypothetical protein [Algibacillus agarilyticus]
MKLKNLHIGFFNLNFLAQYSSNQPSKPSNKQRGAALFTALVAILVLAITGIAIGKQVMSAKRDSATFFDNTLSFVNAETAISNAQTTIIDNAYTKPEMLKVGDADGVIMPLFVDGANKTYRWWIDEAVWTASTTKKIQVTDADGAVLSGSPTYVIEEAAIDKGLVLGVNPPQRRLFRITAKANGLGDSETLVQAYYAIME